MDIHQKINLKTQKGRIVVFDNLPDELKETNDYGVPGSDWEEPKKLNPNNPYHQFILKKYSDYPFEKGSGLWANHLIPMIGVVCTGRDWVAIEGYKPPRFAPGKSWVNEVIPEKI